MATATLALDYPLEEEYPIPSTPDAPGDLMGETPAATVRERWARIKQVREELQLHYSLNPDPVPAPPVEGKTGFLRVLEVVGIWFCRNFHREPMYQPGNLHSTCVCGRKYAVPWAFSTHPTIKPMFPVLMDPDVYVNHEPFVMPTEPTRQAPCRHGTQGIF